VRVSWTIEKRRKKSYFGIVMKEKPDKGNFSASTWTKRAGLIAFLFFLGKGLVWLGIAAAGAYYALY
jgi:hypothetical protein